MPSESAALNGSTLTFLCWHVLGKRRLAAAETLLDSHMRNRAQALSEF